MKHHMLVNSVHQEQKRMATVDERGKLLEFNIQMSSREPITGNIYKGTVLKVERGLQAAFINYGGQRDGFLPLRDVNPALVLNRPETSSDTPANANPNHLKAGQQILVQVVREEVGNKGALLTGYISLPGRYMVLLPHKESSGISRKIENEDDRKRIKELIAQVKIEENMGFIIRTAGYNRTKQELSRDYNLLSRLWGDIRKTSQSAASPSLIYQESDFGVRTLRDYFTQEIEEILVDDLETFKKMRAYCKAVAPRNIKIIKLYKEKTPLFDKYNLEDQIRVIYRERVDLKSGGYIVINPTEAMVTIDVNSGRGSHKKNVEETAYHTNIEAAEEIARQLRLRDIGGLIVIDFIDMADRKHQLDVEKAFKNSLSLDRSRIQLSKISKFGLLELSRQKKQSTIQEISYTACPFCEGSGVRPSLEYIALSAFRKLESQAVRDIAAELNVSLPHEVANYLLNQKRKELLGLETDYNIAISISGRVDMSWSDVLISIVKRDASSGQVEEEIISETKVPEKAAKSKTRTRSSKRRNKESSPSGNAPSPSSEEAPPAPEETLAAPVETTATQEETPAIQGEAPAAHTEAPVTQAETPATQEEASAAQGEAPAAANKEGTAPKKRNRRPYRRKKTNANAGETSTANEQNNGQAPASDGMGNGE